MNVGEPKNEPVTGNVCQSGRISCGIAGWSYPDWDGYVYTPGTRDKLRFIAGYVDMIEINSTFYRPPDTGTVKSWVRRTDDLSGFFFTAKLHQDVTHRGLLDSAMVTAFHTGFEPMTERGTLRHLLAQFRYDFIDTPETREHLKKIRKAFGDITNLTFELRHNSWQLPEALKFLGSLNAAVANLDYPLARNSFSLRACRLGEHAYLRLHGRNVKAWFNRKAGRDETYNYCYSGKELEGIKDRAVDLAEMSKTLTLVANNHYQGKEVVNALQLKAMIKRTKVGVPPKLLEKYPQLEEIRQPPP